MWLLIGIGMWIVMLFGFDWLWHKGIGVPKSTGPGWKDITINE